MSKPLNILMSAMAAETLETKIKTVLKDRPYRLVDLNYPAQANGKFDVDIALMTPDVRGSYGTGRHSPTMARFFEMILGASNLQWVHINAAGADRPEHKELRARNITLTTSSGATSQTVALSAIGGVISLVRNFPILMDAQHRRVWEPLRGDREPKDIAGQTALVVGTGPIGIEVARLMKALRMNVIGMRRSHSQVEHFDEIVTFDELHSVLPRVTWVVLACPLTETTRDLIDAEALALLPRGSYVLNVSRGNVIQEDDLIAALESQHIAGAYLDVFRHEPLAETSPLWSMPNVMVSPHSSSYSNGYYDRVCEIFMENLVRWNAGSKLRNEVA